jgi:16S rRNA (cytosine967-C5)-methyltransferase
MMDKLQRPAGSAGAASPSERSSLYQGARGAAVRILSRVEQSDAYLDKLLNFELSSGELSDPDRRLLTELATGVIRWQGKLDWVLTGFYHGEFSKCIVPVRNALRVALYQILFLTKIPHAAAVNEAVEFVKRLKGERSANLVNAVLRSVIRKIGAITFPDPTVDRSYYLSVVLSHPLWMVRRWIAQLGIEETEAMMEANNRRPSISLRVNPTRVDLEELSDRLRALGVTVGRSDILENVLRVSHFSGIASEPSFQRGEFTVQDEGAILAAMLTGVRPGMRVIDLCAAPGGKSIAMAEMMENVGEIVALDKFEAKQKMIDRAVTRMGYGDTIRTEVGDARSVVLEPADVVLVDAPCSGLGVLARKPDIKWKRRAEDIDTMVELQRTILANAAGMVRPGGYLVYSTCTVERNENEGVVEWFLATFPEFELVPASELLPSSVVTDAGYMQTLPHRHGVDGMFGARLRRKSEV